MKVYHCRHCHNEVSPRAHTCPSCGEPSPAKGRNIWWQSLAKLVFILISFALLISWIFSGVGVEQTPNLYLFFFLFMGILAHLMAWGQEP